MPLPAIFGTERTAFRLQTTPLSSGPALASAKQTDSASARKHAVMQISRTSAPSLLASSCEKVQSCRTCATDRRRWKTWHHILQNLALPLMLTC